MTTPPFFRVGIIGFGMIGKVHAFAHAAMPYYSPELPRYGKVTALATAHRETAEKGAALIGTARAVTDWRAITTDPEIDLVHICSPNEAHCEQILDVIANNKHLYCDKPLCVSQEEAKIIEEALLQKDSSGRLLYTGTTQMTFHLRFFAAMMRAKQLLTEGRLGRIFQYRIGYYHSSNTSPDVPFKWKHGISGGAIRDLGSHLFDLVDHLLGMPHQLIADASIAWPKRAQSSHFSDSQDNRGTPSFERDVIGEDTVSILTRHRPHHQPPFTGIIEATKLATGNEDDLRLEIHGTGGSLKFSLMDSHWLEFFDATAPAEPLGGTSGWTRIACGARHESPEGTFPSPKSTTGWIRAHIAALSNFLQAAAEGRQTSPHLLQGCRVQNALEAVAQSCREGTWVNLHHTTSIM